MNFRDIIDTIKEKIPKIPFLGKGKDEEEEEFFDEGIDLEEKLEEPPGEEPEPEHEREPPEPEPASKEEPFPPAPQKPIPTPTSNDVSEQLKRLANRFETLETELETIKSEADLEKSMLKKYDYYLKEMNKKLTLLEQQHESIWTDLQAKKTPSAQ